MFSLTLDVDITVLHSAFLPCILKLSKAVHLIRIGCFNKFKYTSDIV